MKKTVVTILLTSFLMSCAHFPDHDKDYLKSKNEKELIVPPGLSDVRLSRAYVLPAQTEEGKNRVAYVEPPPLLKTQKTQKT